MPQGFFFGMPGREPTEEELAAAKAEQDRRQLEISAFQHDFQRLFDELPEDQLRTLRTMMQLATCEHGCNTPPTRWEAMIAWAMKVRFNVCVTCGVNHDTEVHAPEPESDSHSTVSGEVLEQAAEVVNEAAAQQDLYGFTDEERALITKYHLDDIYEEGSGEFLYFACTGIDGMKGPCGVTYPTLADRMLKDPESCSGCFQRIMHG